MFDPDQFDERAAIMEYDGGMSRFSAETAAAAAQCKSRWEAINEIRRGNPGQARDHREAADRQSANHMPAMQRGAAQQDRPVPERRVQA